MEDSVITDAQQCSKQKALQCMQHSMDEQVEPPITEQFFL